MTLGELIGRLRMADPDLRVRHGFRNAHSYRGYYDQLAFEPAEDVPVRDMLAEAQNAVGATFTGYKGGDYTMELDTCVWLSKYGESGQEAPLSLAQVEEMLAGAKATDLAAECARLLEHVQHLEGQAGSESCAGYLLRAEKAEAELKEALDALGRLEFVLPGDKCPECFGWNQSPNGETPMKHAKRCGLGALLARLRPPMESEGGKP